MNNVILRKIKDSEMKKAIELVWRTFLEFEAPDYTEEGIKEFKRCIDNKQWISEREFYGAFKDNNIVGVIATKNITHVALFFVNGRFHKKGIGTALFSEIKKHNTYGKFTVNSSPYAHEVYKHLGFIDTDIEQCIKGLKFFPMELNF